MVFSSVVFLFIFLPWTLIVHYFLDPRYRNVFLLISSLIFYSWGEGLLTLLIVASIFVNYLGGLWIEYYKTKLGNTGAAKMVLGAFISLNVLVLLYFKYFNFFATNLQVIGLFSSYKITDIHLPIGISFYTFHIISYLIDVYRGDAVSQKNPFDLGLYIFLFPQLVAGPIIRYKDISQKIASRFIIGEDFTKGAIRFIRGMAKKMILANTAAVFADSVFAIDPLHLPASIAWIGILCYTLQIYFDFSGYSDMALGIGKMLGFNFPENFNYPYVAKSIRDFWQRWHISLSTWFRDYLYIPLGGNKSGQMKTYRNMFIVFFVTGFWHGASWNFIVWGMMHGIFLAVERAGLSKLLNKLPAAIAHLYTLFVVIIAWVFFRADTLSYALNFLKAMFRGNENGTYETLAFVNTYNLIVIVLALVFCTNIRSYFERFFNTRVLRSSYTKNMATITVYLAYLLLFFWTVLELAQNNYNPFIYFRF